MRPEYRYTIKIHLLLILLCCSSYAKSEFSKREYYKNIWKAQNSLLDKDYSESIIYYKKAFELVGEKNIFPIDLINAAYCSYKVSDYVFTNRCKTILNQNNGNRCEDIIFDSTYHFVNKETIVCYTNKLDSILDLLLIADQKIRFDKYKNGEQLYCIDNKKEIIKIDTLNYITLIKNINLFNNPISLNSYKKIDILIIHFNQWGWTSLIDSLKYKAQCGFIDIRYYSKWVDDIIKNYPNYFGFKYSSDGYYGTLAPFNTGKYSILIINSKKTKYATLKDINKNRDKINLNVLTDHFRIVSTKYLKKDVFFYYPDQLFIFNFGNQDEDNKKAEELIKIAKGNKTKIIVYTK